MWDHLHESAASRDGGREGSRGISWREPTEADRFQESGRWFDSLEMGKHRRRPEFCEPRNIDVMRETLSADSLG